MIEVEAELLGYTKLDLFLRIPFKNRILTMPRAFLPWGMATAPSVVLRYEPESLHHDGHGWVVDGEIVKEIDD